MKILIGVPTYDHRIDIDILKTVIHLERESKHEFDYMFPVSSHLARNRNMVCHEALKSGHDAVLFWDSDIGIPDGKFVESMIQAGYQLDAKIIGGAYMMKKLNETIYIAIEKHDKMDNIREKPLGIRLVEGVGTGIMLIYREVLEKLQDPWFTIVDKPSLEVEPEDFNFCRKAREAGFKIALDPKFTTNHYGARAWSHEV